MDSSSLYSSFVSISSTYTKGWLSKHEDSDSTVPIINAFKSVKDLDDNKSRVFLESYTLSSNKFKSIYKLPIEVVKPVIYSVSPSRVKTVSIRADKKFIIEIISTHDPAIRVNLSKHHGDVIGESWFGGQSWSADERYFMYVCKSKEVTKSSNFGDLATDSSQKDKSEASTNKFEYVDDWGERFVDISNLSIAVIDTITGKVTIIPDLHNGLLTIGQPVFSPKSDGKYVIVYTAWSNLPRKLGMVYCYQRPCSLYVADISALLDTNAEPKNCVVEAKLLTSTIALSRSPRFNKDGNKLVFIGRRDPLQTHNGTSELFVIDEFGVNLEPIIRTVVDIVHNPLTNDSFPGIYTDQLPQNCFVRNDSSIILSSLWGGRDALLIISIENASIERIFIHGKSAISNGWNNANDDSVTLLDVSDDYLLLATSNPSQPQQLSLFHLSSSTQYGMQGSVLSMPVATKSLTLTPSEVFLKSVQYKTFRHISNDGLQFESLVILPINVGSFPLSAILVPHGGPQSCITSAFYSSYSYLATRLNAAIIFANYRGSTGYGEASILSLPGNIGRNDVDDCVFCLNEALKLTIGDLNLETDANVDKSRLIIDHHRIAIVGGSHGGFLVGHLIGQYPDMFCAATMRNPVTNMPALVSTSDIPDWCWVEAGIDYDFTKFIIPSEDNLIKLRKHSPIHYIDSVKTPTLLCIGAKDRRVHPTQGLEYYHLLKSRGVPCRLLLFPDDNHAIDNPLTEAEQWLAIGDWLEKYFTIST